jgi:signal transduction histidine kinase
MSDRQQHLLFTLSATRGQKRLALFVTLLLLAIFLVILPFAHIDAGRLDAFVPIVATVMFLNDTITSALLFAQFAVLRTVSLLLLAAGYLFTGLLVVAYILTFPGVFGPTGLLGAGPRSTSWLFLAWHIVFPAVIVAYVLASTKPLAHGSVRTAIVGSIVGVLCASAGLTWFATAHHDALPDLLQDGAVFSRLWFHLTWGSVLLCPAVIAVLWTRRSSLLDLWLLVVAWTWLLKSILLILTEHRYSVAWYANTSFAIFAATFVLIVLLSETTMIYARLALSVMAQRREREGRLMTVRAVAASIAHEVNQPLAAVVNNGNAALRWLSRPAPDANKLAEILKEIVSDGHRASQVVAGIRAMVKQDPPAKGYVDINDIIMEVLVLARGELRNHSIAAETDLTAELPLLKANKVQLQQVLLNLITNAVEAMEAVDPKTRLLRVSSRQLNDEVVVKVEDTGTGIEADNAERVFDPFFTTKPDGTGLGLPISRSIVEAQGGRMWATPGAMCGTVLQLALPLTEEAGQSYA